MKAISSGPKWISVKERLPEEEDEYIVYYGESIVTTLMYIPSEKRFYGWDQYPLPEDVVTHWMPLPKAPKEEQDA